MENCFKNVQNRPISPLKSASRVHPPYTFRPVMRIPMPNPIPVACQWPVLSYECPSNVRDALRLEIVYMLLCRCCHCRKQEAQRPAIGLSMFFVVACGFLLFYIFCSFSIFFSFVCLFVKFWEVFRGVFSKFLRGFWEMPEGILGVFFWKVLNSFWAVFGGQIQWQLKKHVGVC